MPILRALFTLALGVAGLSLLGFVPKIVVGTLLILFSFGLGGGITSTFAKVQQFRTASSRRGL
jgi:hypothetical protein